jgi:predicted enzyme related to lactoylglutathione lyase
MADQPLRSGEHDRRIDYIEFPATDLPATKRFYQQAFGWKFTDYGPDYAAFEDGRLDGGFHAGQGARTVPGEGKGTLAVLFALDLADAEARVRKAGGTIVTPTFSFPGGHRFHFTDPSGNELAVWSDR